MTFGEPIGWLAAALTLLSFSMRSMAGLRITAIGANLAFIAYAAAVGLNPVLILHLMLLPCNLIRLSQILAHRRKAGSIAFASSDRPPDRLPTPPPRR